MIPSSPQKHHSMIGESQITMIHLFFAILTISCRRYLRQNPYSDLRNCLFEMYPTYWDFFLSMQIKLVNRNLSHTSSSITLFIFGAKLGIWLAHLRTFLGLILEGTISGWMWEDLLCYADRLLLGSEPTSSLFHHMQHGANDFHGQLGLRFNATCWVP